MFVESIATKQQIIINNNFKITDNGKILRAIIATTCFRSEIEE